MRRPKAALLLRPEPAFRIDGFASGLEKAGLAVSRLPERDPKPGDVLVLWNRYPQRERFAQAYEAAGATVLVAENGYLGREWRGGFWYALSASHHNGAGEWVAGGPERWGSFGIDCRPWRNDGDEVVILAQRGFGHPKVREPRGWPERALRSLQALGLRARIRRHPGEAGPKGALDVELDRDLSRARACVTWGSGAALKALLLGVPVFNGFGQWIGRSAARPFGMPLSEAFRGDRLPMFRRLAWAMWEIEEIAAGDPFRCARR